MTSHIFVDVYTLNSQQISSKIIALTYAAKKESIKIAVAGQPYYIYGIDYQFVDDGQFNKLDISLTDNDLKVGDVLIVSYETLNPTNDSNVTKIYSKKLTSTDIFNKFIDLPENPISNEIIFSIRAAGIQLESTAFNISGKRISWNGTDLESILQEGDIIVIEYPIEPEYAAEIKVKEHFTIDGKIIETKRLNLHNIINQERATNFILNKSAILTEDFDYKLLETAIFWNNLGLDGMLHSGDKIEIIYHSFDNGLPSDFRLYKINEDFDLVGKFKELVGNDIWRDEAEQFWNILEASQERIGEILVEKVNNFVQNIRDIDVCEINSLYSLAKELNQENIFSFDLNFPEDIRRLINIFSCNPSIVLQNNKILNDSTLSAIWNSNIVRELSAGNINEFMLIFDLSANFYKNLPNINTPNDYYINYFDNNKTILTRDYLLFVDLTIEDLLKSKIDGKLDIDKNYLENPEYYENDNEVKLKVYQYKEAQKYLAFIESIFDCDTCFNSITSGDIIRKVSKKLRNLCLKIYYNRENLKNIAQKYAMYGAHQAIEKLIEEAFLRMFTNPNEWNYYTGKPEDFIYDSSGYTSSLSSDIFLQTYLPYLRDLSAFQVKVIEYYDRTEYLNISAATPFNEGLLGYTTSSITSTWIDSYGKLVSSEIISSIPIYGPDPTCGTVKSGGNWRYWEGDALYLAQMYSELTSSEILDFYRNAIGLNENKFPDLSSVLKFQDILYDIHAASGYIRNAIIDDLSAQKTDFYQNYQLLHIPEDGLIKYPEVLSGIDSKYSGLVSGDSPQINYKNTIYPTVAHQPFIWNIVEKAFKKYPQILETLITKQFILNERKVNKNGDLIDSWKFDNQEFNAYQTIYENDINQDYKNLENKYINQDGPFGIGEFFKSYLYNEIPLQNPSDNEFLKHYLHINDSIRFNQEVPEDEVFKLKFFKNDIFQLSGITINDCEIKLDELDEYKEVLFGKSIYKFDIDNFNNRYMLYKSSRSLLEPGIVWMRKQHFPMSFPVAFSNVPNINSLDLAKQWLLNNEFIQIQTGMNIDDTLKIEHYNGINDNGDEYDFYEIYRRNDGFRIAIWYSNKPGNIYKNVLKITDPNVQQINIGNSPFEDLDNAVNNCFDFECNENDIILLGRDYNGQDRIYIFALEKVNIYERLQSSEKECKNERSKIYQREIFEINKSKELFPASYKINIENYIGRYYTDNYINFVFLDSIDHINKKMILEIIKFNREKRIFET